MAQPTLYETLIGSMDYEGLRKLWHQIVSRRTRFPWNPAKAFEYLVIRAFQLDGATVQYPYEVKRNDITVEQNDGVVYAGGLACLVESKDHSRPINFDPIAKLCTKIMRRPAGTVGLLFSRCGFTVPAVELTRSLGPHTILLWYGDEVGEALNREVFVHALKAKFRRYVEYSLPDYYYWAECLV